jgi:hypothetical protein
MVLNLRNNVYQPLYVVAPIVGPKKIPVVPVSYHEKIRVGRSEIIFF